MKIATLILLGSVGLMPTTIAQATGLPTDVGPYERLTVIGLLLIAVIFLYRELRGERAERAIITAAYKAFIEQQTTAFQNAADKQTVASAQVAKALGDVTTITHRQVVLYEQTIGKFVDQQLKDQGR